VPLLLLSMLAYLSFFRLICPHRHLAAGHLLWSRGRTRELIHPYSSSQALAWRAMARKLSRAVSGCSLPPPIPPQLIHSARCYMELHRPCLRRRRRQCRQGGAHGEVA
jgi:hypothetical protein